MDRTTRQARPRPIGRIFALAVIATVFCSVGLSPVGAVRAAAATSDPIVGDWNVTYGAPAVVTMTLSGGLYTVTAKTPVEVTGATCFLPIGTTIATFSSTGSNTYSGQHGLWYTSNCSFGQWDPMTCTLSGNTLSCILSGGYGTVTFTKVVRGQPGCVNPSTNLVGNPGFESQVAASSGIPAPVTLNNWLPFSNQFGTPAPTSALSHCPTSSGQVTGGYWAQDLPLASDPNPPPTIFDATKPFEFSYWFNPSALGNQVSLVQAWDRGGGQYTNLISVSLTAAVPGGFQTNTVVGNITVTGSPLVPANSWSRVDVITQGVGQPVEVTINGAHLGPAHLSRRTSGDRTTILMGATGGPNSTGSTNVSYDDVYLGSYVPTTTSVTSSANPEAIDQSVTYFASVDALAGSVAPTGTATFTDNGSVIPGCTAIPLVNFFGTMIAGCASPVYVATGRHHIVAQFLGDVGFASSSSSSFTETVSIPGTVTNVASSSNPAYPPSPPSDPHTPYPYSAPVTYTATVKEMAPFTGAPLGQVAFADNGNAIPGCQAVALTNGTASCPVTYSGIAQHLIKASYSGDSKPSSGRLTENMQGANLTTNIWSGYMQLFPPSGVNYAAIEAEWTVPIPNGTSGCSNPPSNPTDIKKSSTWVGIGGAFNQPLIQAGTTSDLWDGRPVYSAWTELVGTDSKGNPGDAQEVTLNLPVCGGDKISTQIIEIAPDKWTMTVRDDTSHRSGSRTVSYHPYESAELVHEQVSGAPLTPTPNVVFDKGRYATSAPGAGPSWQPFFRFPTGTTVYDMVIRDANASATPSAVDSDNDGFQVAVGSAAPGPPTS
jgi:Bacterial Ig-like domain (group 3)